MAVGKNKKLGKKKKGTRKIVDPFSKKEWYDVQAPSVFPTRHVGKTPVTKTIGQKNSRDSLVGRVFEASLGDLKPQSEDDAFRKFKLKAEEVQGSKLLTTFYSLDMTTDKLRSLVRKWHTLIETHVDVKTTDGYLLRLFVIGFTKRRPNQIRKTSYAQHAQVRNIRKKMTEIVQREASVVDLNELVAKLIPEIIGKEIEKATQGIYPLQNVYVRKVKQLRAPRLDINKLLEIHGGADATAAASADVGKPVDKPEKKEETKEKKGKKKEEKSEE
jgi:small subunit ribosomal protein S3Ae